MEKFLQKFEIEARLDSFPSLYETALSEYARFGADILDFEKYPIFTHMAEDVRRIKGELVKDADNLVYAYMLNAAVRERNIAAMNALSSPRAREESDVYDSISLFALLRELPEMVNEHKRRGVPEDVILDTLEMFQNQMGDYRLLHGRLGLSCYMSWMLKFINCEIIRVGRFNLEMLKYSRSFEIFERDRELIALAKGAVIHKSGRILGSADCEDEDGSFTAEITECDEYFEGHPSLGGSVAMEKVRLSKSEWKKFVTVGDTVISVHIPTGGPLTPEICDSDLARGQKIIEKCFTDVKAFYCSSWLLSTELRGATGKEGNVTKFGDRFTRFPRKSGAKDVFDYVFECPKDTPIAELPEKSSFARAIKAYMLNGGKIYETDGVFRKFNGEAPLAVIPMPLQIVVDDVGWFNGTDDRKDGGPSRTGMPRRHTAEDVRALNVLGERLGMKLNCALVVGEWDPDNRLREVPHLSKYGEAWDNASYLDRDEMARMIEAINDSPYVEVALHGLLHGYYLDGTDNHDTSDFYYRKNKELIMVDEDEIRLRVEKFKEILDFYGVKKELISYVPPSFAVRWGELSRIMADYGFKYSSTIFRTMVCEGEKPVTAGVENGIVTVDRINNLIPWNECDSSFEDLPPVNGVFGAHMPNFLHPDSEKSLTTVERAVKYFKKCAERYGTVMSRGIEFCAVQSMYQVMADVKISGKVAHIDLKKLADTPVQGKPFVVSTAREIVGISGARVAARECVSNFFNYEIIPESTSVTLEFPFAGV